MNDTLETPLFFSWEVTNQCNLRCKICYNASGEKFYDEITPIEVTDVVEKIAACKPLFINLGGGETLLRPDIENIVQKLIGKGIDVSLVTNGTVYHEELFLRLKKLGIKNIQVSLDGFEEAHDHMRGKGSFQKSIKTLKFLINQNFTTMVALVVTKLNHRELPAFVKLLIGLGVKKIAAFRFVPTGRGKINAALQLNSEEQQCLAITLAELEGKYGADFFKCDHSLAFFAGEKKEGGGCELGQKFLNIRPNGDVLGCPFLPIVVGNIRKESLVDIWHNSKALKEIRDEVQLEKLSGKCQNCQEDIKETCRAGCRALAYEVSGSLSAPDPRCWR